MVEVKFYDTVNDELLKFAVIISQSNGKWVFCKHKKRQLGQREFLIEKNMDLNYYRGKNVLREDC